MNKYNRLQKFRLDTHQMLVKSKDATFQLMAHRSLILNLGSPINEANCFLYKAFSR